MVEHGIRVLPVFDGAKFIGIVTNSDIVNSHSNSSAVRYCMTTRMIVVEKNLPLEAAIDLMEEKGIHHLPVVERDKLLGIISFQDIEIELQNQGRHNVNKLAGNPTTDAPLPNLTKKKRNK